MLVKKENAIKKQIAKNSFVWEYNLKSKKLGLDLASINGRFPDAKRTLNKTCHEAYFVISGKGKLIIEGKKIELNKGSIYLIEPEKRYYLVGKKLMLAIATHPRWFPEQQKLVE